MQHVSLYGHSQMVQVWLDQGPIQLCVSRVPLREKSGGRRGRLLLLHGNPASMHDFGHLASLLRDEFEVAAIDLPGFGRSGNVRPVAHESMLDTHARHIVAAAERIGWDDFYLLGHSHGSAVAQTIAARFPERMKGLILLGALGTPTPWCYKHLVAPGVMHGLRAVAQTLNYAIPRPVRWRLVQAIMRPIFAPHPLSHQWIDEQLAVVEGRPEILVNMALVATNDPCEQLGRQAPQIRTPTLFIHGAADTLLPAKHARAIYSVISRTQLAEFYELPETGHMLHISHPAEICDLLFDWHRRLPSAHLGYETADVAE